MHVVLVKISYLSNIRDQNPMHSVLVKLVIIAWPLVKYSWVRCKAYLWSNLPYDFWSNFRGNMRRSPRVCPSICDENFAPVKTTVVVVVTSRAACVLIYIRVLLYYIYERHIYMLVYKKRIYMLRCKRHIYMLVCIHVCMCILHLWLAS
jgi:hypothetical protein